MSGLDLVPGATWHPSTIEHPTRRLTLGIVIHWTVGKVAGDLATLDGPSVDCHFYVTKAGRLYQLLDPDEEAWHAKATANATCLGIETEGSGEPWTPPQLDTVARLTAYLCKRYAIPVIHTDPSAGDLSSFRGIFGHRDLALGGIRVDGNNHTDSVPQGTGWGPFLVAVTKAMGHGELGTVDLSKLPKDGSLRLVVGGKLYAGWDDAIGPMRWIDRKGIGGGGLKDPDAFITWDGKRWDGPRKVLGVTRHLLAKFKL